MKSTWFTNRRHYDFARCLHDADYGRWGTELLRTWLDCVYLSFRQAVNRLVTGEMDPDVEQNYLRAINTVKKPKRFPEALAILTDALNGDQYDFLGCVFTELGANDSKFKGQCFTPRGICELMAKMNMHDVAGSIPTDSTFWINDPCSGGGAMLLAVADELKRRKIGPERVHFVATDVDWRCYAMTYIQTTLCGIPCICEHGNTLTLEKWSVQRNINSWLFPPLTAPETVQPVGDSIEVTEPQHQMVLPGVEG